MLYLIFIIKFADFNIQAANTTKNGNFLQSRRVP
jgi:hypothetical protein